jgi:hypothetical protein|nr:MAG TPA: hypothetical protein [Bacteriophage sp.]
MKRPIDKAFENLTMKQVAQMVEEFNNETISPDALIRQVASEVFEVEKNKTSIMQMQLIVIHCAIYMSRFILRLDI